MNSDQVTGVILAGGLGQRMGNTDKGLVSFNEQPLIQCSIERLAPQVDELLINANQNLEQYQRFGYCVVQDDFPGFAGPLAGLHAGLKIAKHSLVATVPCDSPFFPLDLISRLKTAMRETNAELAVAISQGERHPVFCLCRREVLASLNRFLESGERKMRFWQQSLDIVEVAFDDQPEAFENINTREALSQFEAKLRN